MAAGMIGDPDPYTATMNARPVLPHLRDRHLDAARETARSGWPTSSSSACTSATNKPVEHVESHRRAGGAPDGGRRPRGRPRTSTSTTGRRRPTAPRGWTRRCSGCCSSSSREIMVFGAFFTAYFFIRVVQGAEWPAEGTELPKLIAGVNTAILISSSFTLHWAETRTRRATGAACRRASSRRSCSAHVPVHPDQRVRPPRLLAAGQRAGHDLLRPHRPARRARVRRPDAAAVRHDPGVPRALHPEEHRGVEVPGIYWHFVDVMWIVVYTTVYII